MPFVITSQPATADQAVAATLCESNLLGQPDRRNSVPIMVRQLSERELVIEPDDPHEIVSAIHRDGITTFAINPSRKDFAASARLARLTKATELLEQLHRIFTVLPADIAALDHLTALSAWVKSQLTGDAPQPKAVASASGAKQSGQSVAEIIARRETR